MVSNTTFWQASWTSYASLAVAIIALTMCKTAASANDELDKQPGDQITIQALVPNNNPSA